MTDMLLKIWNDDNGQDIAEYALMLALILVLVMASVSAIGTNANTIFGKVGACMAKAAAGTGC